MLTIEIKTSKAIGIQLLRHRSFTFQEFSQRYAIVENIEPIELRKQAIDNRQSSTEVFNPKVYYSGYNSEILANYAIEKYLEQGQKLYKDLLNKGVARECARMILPMCTETTIFMSGTIRSWIHFIDIRIDGHAQKEAQLIAQKIKKIFKEQLPLISNALNY